MCVLHAALCASCSIVPESESAFTILSTYLYIHYKAHPRGGYQYIFGVRRILGPYDQCYTFLNAKPRFAMNIKVFRVSRFYRV